MILANPFERPVQGKLTSERQRWWSNSSLSAQDNDGMVPSSCMLLLHVAVLSKLRHQLSAVLLVVPSSGSTTLRGYDDDLDGASKRLNCSLEIMPVANNSLGSYGMFMHAFAVHRQRFGFYVFSEVDYVPMLHRFDSILIALFRSAFPVVGRPGMLTGIVRGRALDERSSFATHPESSAIMSSAGLERAFHHVFAVAGWKSSVSDYLVHLVRTEGSLVRTRRNFTAAKLDGYRMYHVQEGFGLLMSAAGIPILDWTSAFRSPYWTHRAPVMDYTGGPTNTVPVQRILFAPSQLLFTSQLRRCCHAKACSEEDTSRKGEACHLKDWRKSKDCCRDEQVPKLRKGVNCHSGKFWRTAACVKRKALFTRANNSVSLKSMADAAPALLPTSDRLGVDVLSAACEVTPTVRCQVQVKKVAHHSD